MDEDVKTWYIIYKKLADELSKFYTQYTNYRNENLKDNYEKGNEYFSRFINSDQNKLAGEIFYAKCKSQPNFFSLYNWANNISEESLDPFHIFVSFNNNNTTLDKKRERIQFYFDVLEYKINVSEYLQDNRFSVPHIPVLKLLTNRTKTTQDEIWKFFIGIVENDKKIIKQGFQDYKKWYGIGFVVITEMLFWVDSSKYISLDKNTSKLLLKYSVINKIPNKYESYFALVQKKEKLNLSDNIFRILIKYTYDDELPKNENEKKELFSFLGKEKNIKSISIHNDNEQVKEAIVQNLEFHKYAYNDELPKDENKKNELLKFHGELEKKESSLIDKDEQEIIQNLKFQLIAIKVLDNQNKRYKKNLLKNELYQFNKNFEFENDVIKYYKKRDIDLYKIDDIDINVNVIVGENGSGKSTLLELAFMIINNVSRRIFEKQKVKKEEIQVEYIDGINAELYFVTDHLYKITINDKTVTVEKFKQIDFNDERIIYGQKTDCTISFDNLYYTNHINYSLHSLNQNYFGDWIYNLFHKNDGYQTPIVLEPYRDRGNIDINLLQALMKSRLLSYIFDNSNESFKQLTKKTKVKNIVLAVDYFKFTSYDANVPSKKDFENLADNLKNVFNFDTTQIMKIVNEFIDNSLVNVDFDRNKYINDGDDIELKENFKDVPIEFFFMMYIFNKLNSIIAKYKDFVEYKKYKIENKLEALLKVIKEDTSHVTFKIRQAIYNLKYIDQLKFQNKEMPFEITKLSNTIGNEILPKESEFDSDLRLDDLIPSSIFKVDIILENNESFDSLSSGEKQKIFVINSIMYHLKNIASIDNGYRNINIVLDEIELYFHPEMQRDFINDLLDVLKNNDYIHNYDALNFMFITHSPFILSDVTENNLLMLDKNALPLKENKRTFGANIYDLLHDGFFMQDGFIGKFAEKKITQIIDIIKLYKILQQQGNRTNIRNLVESYSEFYRFNAWADDITFDRIAPRIEASKNKLFDIVDTIGEPVLRNKLSDELRSIFEKNQDIDLINIINNLKNKTYDEMKKELKKYSNETQEKILHQLFGKSHD